jgi:hypothetical protein
MTPTLERATLAELAGTYSLDPLGFVLDCIEGTEALDTWQRQFLEDLGRAVRERNFDPYNPLPVEPIRMAVASGHGIGKSTLISYVFWWIMSTRPNAKGRVTANTYTQLETTTWAEIQKWGKLCRFKSWFEITGSKIYHLEARESWFAAPVTCAQENSEAFAGQHNRESTSFYLFDEASLIPDTIWEVADNGLTDGEPMWFAFGNPTRNTGKFYEACFGGWQHRWDSRSIDSRTCKFPNHDLHDQWIADHGLESDYVKTRIRGLPPAQAEGQLIGRDLVESAQRRRVEMLPDDPLIAGVDVPDGGSAWFVVRFRRGLDSRPGRRIPAPVRVAGSKIDRPTMIATCAELLSETSNDGRIAAMFVDAAFGAAIVERLNSIGHKNVHEISFGGKSPDPRYGNMRAYMWAKQLKDWLGKGAIDPGDRKLAADLMAPGFHQKLNGDGAFILESKDDIKEHYADSIDDADALALTFARHVAPEQKQQQLPIRRRPIMEYTPFG